MVESRNCRIEALQSPARGSQKGSMLCALDW